MINREAHTVAIEDDRGDRKPGLSNTAREAEGINARDLHLFMAAGLLSIEDSSGIATSDHHTVAKDLYAEIVEMPEFHVVQGSGI